LNQAQHPEREPVHPGLVRQAASRDQRVQAVASRLVGGDVAAYIATRRALRQQRGQEVGQVLLGAGDVIPAVEQHGEIRVAGLVSPALVGDQRAGRQHRFEPTGGVARSNGGLQRAIVTMCA
jgi:hypothetical protein